LPPQKWIRESIEKKIKDTINLCHQIFLEIVEGDNLYGMATISRILQTIILFCRISCFLYGSFTKETHTCKEPTNRSHPVADHLYHCVLGFEQMQSKKKVWKREVGSLKLQVSVEKISFCRSLLRKRPIILRSLLLEATP